MDENDLRSPCVPYDTRGTFDRACFRLLVLMCAISGAILVRAACRPEPTAATRARFNLH